MRCQSRQIGVVWDPGKVRSPVISPIFHLHPHIDDFLFISTSTFPLVPVSAYLFPSIFTSPSLIHSSPHMGVSNRALALLTSWTTAVSAFVL